jgi:hypothetical protein
MEVLFDRICRENEITHRLTAPPSPTTTEVVTTALKSYAYRRSA